MALASVGLVQTLQPPRPVGQPQPVSVPPEDRRDADERVAERSDAEPRRAAPEPGKGTLVDKSA